MHRLDEARLDRRDECRMRIERPVPANLTVESERLRVRRQQQFDRCRVEADAVVEPLDPVFGVDALDRHHGHQHLDLGDLRRIAGEQRLDVVRLGRLDHEVDPVARHVNAGQGLTISLTCAITMPLRNAVASTMAGVSSVFGPVYRLPRGIGGLRGDEAHLRCQVDEIASEQFEIGVDRADLDAALADQLREPRALRSGKGKVEALCDAPLEQVDVLRQREHRLHEVQVVNPARDRRRPEPRARKSACF